MPPPRQETRTSGFALILALSLMAFVLLLLLSMTLLVRIQNTTCAGTLAQLQARESARLALIMSIGELQHYVGPDQRVTARAAITGTQHPFWTGVWDTTTPAAEPRWLVSWQDQSQPAAQNTMPLVRAGSAGADASQHVSAPIIEVLDLNAAPSGAIAWWVSDEGVKASVGGRPLHRRDAPNFISTSSLGALSTQLIASHGLEEIFEDYDRFTSSDAAVLDRIISLEQLFGQPDFTDPMKHHLSGESPFHALTPQSLGVLASVLPGTNGGFMQDLSLFPKLIGPEFEAISARAEAAAQAKSATADPVQKLRQFTHLRGLDELGTLTQGQLLSPVTPILSNFMMAFTIRSEAPVSNHPNFYLRMRFFCELWNPYTCGLRMRATSGEDLDLELEITGLPEVIVEKTSGSPGTSLPINLQNLLQDPANTEGALIIRLHYDQNEDWLPGRTKNWTGLDASTATGASPYHSTLTDGKAWHDANNTLGGSSGIDTGIPRLTGRIRHTSTTPQSLRVRLYSINPASGDRSLLTEQDGIEYDPVSTRPAGYSSTHSGSTFGYHFILRGPQLSTADPEFYRGLWLHDHDPRNPQPAFTRDWQLDNDSENATGSPYVPVKDGINPLLRPDPAEINETDNTINTVVFRRVWDRSRGSGGAGHAFNQLWQDAPLFELPRERILALASLQHLYFHDERPFQVGNSWGDAGAINTLDWFDRYYFSGFSRSDIPAHYRPHSGLPNPALLPFDFATPAATLARWQASSPDDASAAIEPAQHAFVRNRFNLNSTSVAAWKAVLGGLRIHAWDYLDYPNDTADLSTLSLAHASRARMFSRFSHSLGETYDAPQTPAFEESEPVAPSAYYRRGARYFDRDQIERLAEEIVLRLKRRGAPFVSMQAFLAAESPANSSLLEQAIAAVFAPDGRQQWDHLWETTGIRSEPAALIAIDHFSPGFLTQADVLCAIGPMLAPRSDTFKIRARAECYSPLGETTATATVEATLQRTPEAIDPTRPANLPAARKLRLLSIRWLSDDQL